MNETSEKYITSLKFSPVVSTIENVDGSLFGCFMLDAQQKQELQHEVIDDPEGRKPIRLELGAICICLRGSGTAVLNGVNYEVGHNDMVILFPRTIVQELGNTPDFLGYTVAINTEFMASIKARSVVQSYVSIRENPVIHLDDEQTSNIIELCEMLKAKNKRDDHFYRQEINRALLSIISYEIHNICLHQQPHPNLPRSRQDVIFQEFLDLVEKNYASQREISYYADRLCITPKYLSVVVKNISGISPTEWINRAVLLNAKTMLATTDLTVQQISAELNFPNPSFFGQYFKRITGITPKRYRTRSKS